MILHGLGATYYKDLNLLEAFLQSQCFSTFSITYGEYAAFPLVGGLEPIQQTGVQIACFVQEVQDKTGVAKIDLVGHSKGCIPVSIYSQDNRSLSDHR